MEAILFTLLIAVGIFILVVWVVASYHFRGLEIPGQEDVSKKIVRVFAIGTGVLFAVSAILLAMLIL